GTAEVAGAQAEAARVPQADGTRGVLQAGAEQALMPSPLTFSDLVGTGNHRPLPARAGRGGRVPVGGAGAAGLCGVTAARRLGAVGRVGAPHYEPTPASEPAFYNNVTVSGGPAPVRAYIGELLPDVLKGRIEPGHGFDRVISLDKVPDGYRAMNERESIKVMVKL